MAVIRLQGKEEIRKRIYYEFESTDTPLGVGGMGKVYKGRCVDERNGYSRDVAIKFMYDDLPEHVIERARREASIQIHNDNLVEMLGFVETETRNMLGESQRHYHVVSELLEGVMLDDLLKGKVTDQWGTTVPFAEQLYRDYNNAPVRFALYIIKSILTGIMSLHDIGYIHRDIDPTNIMVTAQGHVKLIDFGIAKQLSTLTTHDKALTSAGQFMGKAQYAAPELVLGDVRHQNCTTDIYAVGIILFRLVVGHLPFEGATHEVLDMQLHRKIPLQQVRDRRLREVIARATHKKQERRFQSAAEFRVAVDQLAVTGNGTGIDWNILLRGAAIVAGVCAVGAGGFWAYEKLQSDKGRKEAVVIEKVKSRLEKETINKEPRMSDFEKARQMLCSASTAPEGLKRLEVLSANNEFDATYLLSRLYADDSDPSVSDEIRKMKHNGSIRTDLLRAHELNQLSVEQNGESYKALYELGTDFLAGSVRTGMPNKQSRNLSLSYTYLKKAWNLARDHNDKFYAGLIEKEIRKIPAKYKK